MATFDVDVGGATYEVDAPDEATAWKWAKATHLQATPKRNIASEIDNDPISQGAREAMKPSVIEDLGRQTLMTGRHLLGAFGGDVIADKLSLPKPQNARERVVGDIARTMAGTAGVASVARQAIPALQGVPQRLAEMLSAAPASQIASAAGAGAGAGLARESGSGPTGQMAAALAGGIAVPVAQNVALGVGRAARNVVDPWLPGGIERAVSRTANEAAGHRRADVLRALQNPDDFVGAQVTAGEAAAKAGSAEFAGMQEVIKGRMPSEYDAIGKAQAAARAAALRKFGGTPESLQSAEQSRNAITGPMREAALKNANIAGVKVPQLQERAASQRASMVSAMQNEGRMATSAAQSENMANGGQIRLTPRQIEHDPFNVGVGHRVVGRPLPSGLNADDIQKFPILARDRPDVGNLLERVPEAKAAAADFGTVAANRRAQAGLSQYQLDSLAAHGHYPLDANKVVGAIDSMLTKPGDRAVTLNQKILSAVRDKVASLVDKNGTIDSRDLYAIRKSDINDVVATLTKDMDASTKNRAASLVNSIKSDIDNAIEGAGGTGWKEYLKTYADKSRSINQMQVGQFLENKLTAPMAEQGAGTPQRAAMYSQALRDAPGTLKRSTGNPRYEELSQVLTPDQLAITTNVGKDLGRSAEQARLGSLGAEKARTLLGAVSPALPPAGMFSPVYSVLRAVTNRLHGRVEGKSLDALAKAMQDPREMARIMQAATPKEKSILAPYLPTAPIVVGAQAMGQQP